MKNEGNARQAVDFNLARNTNNSVIGQLEDRQSKHLDSITLLHVTNWSK